VACNRACVSCLACLRVVRAYGGSGIHRLLEPATFDGLVYLPPGQSCTRPTTGYRYHPCLLLLGLWHRGHPHGRHGQGWSHGPVVAIVRPGRDQPSGAHMNSGSGSSAPPGRRHPWPPAGTPAEMRRAGCMRVRPAAPLTVSSTSPSFVPEGQKRAISRSGPRPAGIPADAQHGRVSAPGADNCRVGRYRLTCKMAILSPPNASSPDFERTSPVGNAPGSPNHGQITVSIHSQCSPPRASDLICVALDGLFTRRAVSPISQPSDTG